jgi:cytoskeletal protein CcmA (bactofilin family)
MFNNAKRPEPAQAIHTLLGKGTLWKGEIQAGQNSLRIEGTVEGIITSDGEVTIAPTGEVRGTIHAKHLIVTGRVNGVFKIVECLEIHGTGYVEGEVEVGSLVVDEGGTLQGNCTRRGIAHEPVALVPPPMPAPVPPVPVPPPAPTGPVPAILLPPLSPLSPAVGHANIAASSRNEEMPSDRHVFNMANGLAPASAGEHAYSKTKL